MTISQGAPDGPSATSGMTTNKAFERSRYAERYGVAQALHCRQTIDTPDWQQHGHCDLRGTQAYGTWL
tara:strand:- start:51 stop:254 length:204 start_codon:yes stop_codon:yes gene_type:complete